MHGNNRIVLDTNCLLACISSKSVNYRVWHDFQAGRFVLCVSNEILEEYQEVIARKSVVEKTKSFLKLFEYTINVGMTQTVSSEPYDQSKTSLDFGLDVKKRQHTLF